VDKSTVLHLPNAQYKCSRINGSVSCWIKWSITFSSSKWIEFPSATAAFLRSRLLFNLPMGVWEYWLLNSASEIPRVFIMSPWLFVGKEINSCQIVRSLHLFSFQGQTNWQTSQPKTQFSIWGLNVLGIEPLCSVVRYAMQWSAWRVRSSRRHLVGQASIQAWQSPQWSGTISGWMSTSRSVSISPSNT